MRLGTQLRKKSVPTESATVTWRCFQCGHTVLQPVLQRTRDGGHWCAAPPDWLFVADRDELTFVCSLDCLKSIYSNDT